MTCKGMNCTYDPPEINDHSLECEAQHAAAIAGGTFVKWSASQGEQASKQKSRETNKALAKPLSDVFRNFGKEPEIMPLIDAYATARGEVGNEHFSHECLALREQIRTKLLGEQASKRVALTDEQWKEKLGHRQLFSILEAIRFVEIAYGIEAHITGEKTE